MDYNRVGQPEKGQLDLFFPTFTQRERERKKGGVNITKIKCPHTAEMKPFNKKAYVRLL